MKGKKLIEWRRNQIISYSSKGCDQATIAKILHVGEATISRDMTFLKEQAKRNIQTFIDDRLPYEYNQTLNGLTAILREAWAIAGNHDIDRREKIQVLSLAKECYSQKLDLLTNDEVIHNSIKFIENHKQKKAKEQEESEDRIEKLLSSSTLLSTEEEEQEQEEAERGKEEEEDEEQEDKEEAEIF